MDTRRMLLFSAAVFCMVMMLGAVALADHPGFVISSPGRPGASITFDGAEGAGEWALPAGFSPTTVADYGSGNPLSATVKAFHKADGIYLLIAVTDASNNNNDAVQVRFDMQHDHGAAVNADDWGIEIRRNAQALWGAAITDPATWAPMPAGTFGVTSTTTGWTAEVHIPTGAPSNLTIGTKPVGIHLMLYDADAASGTNSAKYTQWPQPPAASPDDLLDAAPVQWGNYEFDPASTFADVAVTGVRNVWDGPEHYYHASYTQVNPFEIQVKNPGGTAIPDATNVRLNLYLAARGIGEPWHRLDTETVLNGDCSAATWTSAVFGKSDVCSGSNSLEDISAKTINDVVSNTAKYTIKYGMPMTRVGGQSITVAGGFQDWIDVLEWDTTNDQDNYFKEVVVNGTTYRRQHQCMKAEAIVPNDPNNSDNVRQVNMDFITLSEKSAKAFFMSLGWAGFGKYDANAGKDMFLHVETKNLDPRAGWAFPLIGVERVGDNRYKAKLTGKKSLAIQADITAPAADVLGRTLKENLIVPPKAGGLLPNTVIPSGASPVYVQVQAGSTLWIANYDFSEQDRQSVDLDGSERLLPPNGPEGLSLAYLQKLLKEAGEKYRILLAPNAPVGSLVGSFDNFRTVFKIGGGVQVRVPAGARYLALAINDVIGLYGDNTGTGFRVKVLQRPDKNIAPAGAESFFASLMPEALALDGGNLSTTALSDVMPTICVNGYEAIGKKRTIGGKPHELYRYIGNVCWAVLNVYPQDRPERPDQGDGYVPDIPRPDCCRPAKSDRYAVSSLLVIAGLVVLRQRVARRKTGE